MILEITETCGTLWKQWHQFEITNSLLQMWFVLNRINLQKQFHGAIPT